MLKAFLTDIYGCGFPSGMDDKIIIETKQLLDKLVLDNIQYFETCYGPTSHLNDSVKAPYGYGMSHIAPSFLILLSILMIPPSLC